MKEWDARYPQLHGIACTNVEGTVPDDPMAGPEPDLLLTLADGSRLKALYWRLFAGPTPKTSSFDHGHQYGLPARIDAFAVARAALLGRTLQHVLLHAHTADLQLQFDGGWSLMVFNFSGYEVWELSLRDGTLHTSTLALAG